MKGRWPRWPADRCAGSCDHVEREAHQLEAEIERDGVAGRDQHQHAERRQQDQDREFEPGDPLAAHKLERQDQRHQGADQRQSAHETRERVVGEGTVERDPHRPVLGDEQNEREPE
jgi:hypothetical protein